MSDDWRITYYPNGEFYMIWSGTKTDWKEYKTREEAQQAIDDLVKETTKHERS